MSRIPLYLVLAVSGVLAIVASPPDALVDLIGSGAWAHAIVGLLLFLSLSMVLNVLGLTDGEITLPFGVGAKTGASAGVWEALHTADQGLFEIAEEVQRKLAILEERSLTDVSELRDLNTRLAARIAAIEEQGPADTPALAEER
jgi:hypothetical protein